MVKFKKIRIIPKINKKHKGFALAAAVIMMASVFGLSSSYAVNAQTAGIILKDGEATTEATTEGDGKTEEQKQTNIMDAQTTRIGFWEWEEVTSDNARSILSDSKYHASMLIPCYSQDTPAMNGGTACVRSTNFKTNAGDDFHQRWNAAYDRWVTNVMPNYWSAQLYKDKYFKPMNKYSNKSMPFISTYADRKHVAYGPIRKNGYHYYDDFPMTSVNVESDIYNGYYGKYDSGKKKIGEYGDEQHSPSYYFSAGQSMYIEEDDKGKYSDIPQSYFTKKKFFSMGDSMGVPWIKNFQMNSDCTNIAVTMNIPTKQLTNAEASKYTPQNGKDYFLYSATIKETGDHGYEPIMFFNKYDTDGAVSKNDYIHMKTVGKANNIWWLAKFDNNTDNEICLDCYGKGVTNNSTDMVLLTYLPKDGYQWEITFQGSWRERGVSTFKWYVGTPHEMTALKTQTIKDGKLMALNGGMFASAKDDDGDGVSDAGFTDGYILQKDKVLTIDGGTVTVGTNFINNGKIVIKNGGTLLIKSGGCMYPFMENTLGNIECNGGNIIIMEGGRLYSLTDKADLNNSATLKLTGGSTLINYGGLAVTRATIDKGSKIENRNKAVLYAGVNRKDELVFLDKCTLNKSNMQNLEWISSDSSRSVDILAATGNIYHVEAVNTKLFGSGYQNTKYETSVRTKNLQYYLKLYYTNNKFEYIKIPTEKLDDWFELVDRYDELEMYYFATGASSGSHDTSSYLKKGYGLEGVDDNKPTVVLEKTSTAVTLNPKSTGNIIDMANDSTIDIIVPEY